MSSSLSNSPVLVSLISAAGGILITYITYVASQKVQNKRAARQPKDRMERMFDGYERLIRAKDLEDERKTKTITNLENMVEQLEKEVNDAKDLVARTRQDQQVSKDENVELRKSLRELRQAYDIIKRQQKQGV